jgi:hypothetical protein
MLNSDLDNELTLAELLWRPTLADLLGEPDARPSVDVGGDTLPAMPQLIEEQE